MKNIFHCAINDGERLLCQKESKNKDRTSDSDHRTCRECSHTQEVVATKAKGRCGPVLRPWAPCRPGLVWRKGSYSLDQPSERNRCVFYMEPRFLNLPLEICTHTEGDRMGAELVPVMRVRVDIVACCSELEF